MPKGKTISARWSEWTLTPGEWVWAHTALITFIGSILGLLFHLWFLSGPVRTIGLIVMIVLATITETILYFRARKVPTVWWWFWFHTYVVVGVIFFELASYTASSTWGF